jgi:hypothetical protein
MRVLIIKMDINLIFIAYNVKLTHHLNTSNIINVEPVFSVRIRVYFVDKFFFVGKMYLVFLTDVLTSY